MKFPTVRKSNLSLLGSPLQLYSSHLIVVACCVLASRRHYRVDVTHRRASSRGRYRRAATDCGLVPYGTAIDQYHRRTIAEAVVEAELNFADLLADIHGLPSKNRVRHPG